MAHAAHQLGASDNVVADANLICTLHSHALACQDFQESRSRVLDGMMWPPSPINCTDMFISKTLMSENSRQPKFISLSRSARCP